MPICCGRHKNICKSFLSYNERCSSNPLVESSPNSCCVITRTHSVFKGEGRLKKTLTV